MSKAKSFDFLFNQIRNGGEGSIAGGTVIFYSAGTTTPKAVYLDRNMALPSAAGILTPYPLTADGTASLFGLGLYDIIIKDSGGAIVYYYHDVEMFSAEGNGYEVAPTEFLMDATAGNINETWTAGTKNILAMRVDASATYTATLTLPVGYTLAGSGAGTYTLSTQGESVHLYLPDTGTVYYVV